MSEQYEVVLSGDANNDLDGIYDYIAQNESRGRADHVIERILDIIRSLSSPPERGSRPTELRDAGAPDYRQVHFKPYRIIYRVVEDRVRVYLIADPLRNMQALLQRRLLSGR